MDLFNVGNETCGDTTCDDMCQYCEHSIEVSRCVPRPCFDVPSGQCKCPRLSEETLIAVGAVVLCLVLLLLAMAVWHWRRCGDLRSSTFNTTENNHTESLLASHGHEGANREAWSRPTRGRTSIDSTVSCLVCMDVAINCVLMPCAHEVACLRCAQRLHLCPVCRTAVDATMKIHVASQEQLLEAALDRARDLHAASSETLPEAETPARPAPEADQAVTDTLPSLPAVQAGGGGELGVDIEAGEEVPSTEAASGQEPAKAQQCEMLCLRCAKLPPNCVFLPCAHKVWCMDCAAQLPPTCPICDSGITQSLRTFHKRLG